MVYKKWEKYLDKSIKLSLLELAGRGNRGKEPYYNSMQEAVEDIYKLMELDLDEEGYRTIFHWFDRLIDVYERVAVEYEAVNATKQDDRREMDLFGWSEMDSKRPRALTDPARHAVEGFGHSARRLCPVFRRHGPDFASR